MAEERGYWLRAGRAATSRRRALQAAALGGAGLAAAGLIGCGQDGTRPASVTNTEQVKQPKRGGTITRAGGSVGTFDTQAVGFDPYTYLALAAEGYRLFYQGLLGYHFRSYEVEPELAQKWEQPSQTEYILTLQPGVKWQNKAPVNGRALTVDDVVFSLERARTNEPRFFSRAVLINVDKIEAVDQSRVRITTKGLDAATLAKIAGDLLLILAPEVVEKAGRFATADTAVGTGPFIIKSAEDGVGAEYVRNPDYWKQGLPYLDGFRTLHFKDEQTAYAAFQGRQVDITRLHGTQVKEYVGRQAQGYKEDWFEENSNVVGQPNTKVKPMDDPRVYRALRLLMDHNEMISAWSEVWFGRGRHESIFPPALGAWDLTHEEYSKLIFWKNPKDDAAKEALSLLGAAGFNAANPLRFELMVNDTPFQLAWAQLTQAQWRKFGQGVVDATLKVLDIATSNVVRGNRQFTYLIHGFIPSVNEPDAWLGEYFRTGAATNFTNFSDPRVDSMIDRQRTIFDIAQRKAAVKEIVNYMIENGPISTPAGRYHLNGLNPNVRDYAPEFYMNGRQYDRVWLDS